MVDARISDAELLVEHLCSFTFKYLTHPRTDVLALLAGSAFYLASVGFVLILNTAGGWAMGSDVWGEWMARPLWHQLHGDAAFFTNPRGIENTDFKSFFIFVQITAALAASVVAASVAQVVAYRRGSAAKRVHEIALNQQA